MLEVDQVHECKRLFGREVPIREIARRLAISRNTVRRYLRGAPPGRYVLSEERKAPAQERIRARVEQMLDDEAAAETPRKQRLTAARIFRILRDEQVEISDSTVRKLVRKLRRERRDPLEHAYLPLEYDPGVDAQVDFFEAYVDDIAEGRTKVHVLLVRACYSGRTFAYIAPNQTRAALLEGLTRAFEFFGGVFRKLWFDNLTPVVRRVLKGRSRDVHAGFEVFQAHHGFETEFCRPGRGNEKGGVENAVKFARHEVLSPIPQVDGREDLQKRYEDFMERELARRARGRELTIGELWRHEQPNLMPLPPRRFDAATIRSAHVSPRSWIALGTNYYSVPVRLVGHEVTVKIDAEELVVLDRGEEVARHRRSYGKHGMVLTIDHYLPLLLRKSRGIDRAVPVRRFLEAAPRCWRTLLTELRRAHGEFEGSKMFVLVVELVAAHGHEAVTAAIERALGHPEISLGTIRYQLRSPDEAGGGFVEALAAVSYPGPEVRAVSPSVYSELGVSHG